MLTTLALAPSCVTQTWIISGTGDAVGLVLGNPHDTSCWPGNRDISTTISPAICPVGYVSACDVSSKRDDSETVWACCPSGFTCDDGFYSCLSGRTNGVTKTYIATDVDRLGNTVTTTATTADGINAHSIRVAFHSSDLIITPSSTPGAISTPTSAVENNISDSGHLSAGATAGIGVGVGIGTFLLLSSIAWLAWRQCINRRRTMAGWQEAPEPESKSAPYSAQIYSTTRPIEMDCISGVHELDTRVAGEPPTNRPFSNTNTLAG
ncbi:uncharacterized protein F4822DRAFT_424863 [Hypoxylon trugodes]|uniref:uncharacterized protein n=1 Tax=Hypoxylon trugodes TaxID=326681 RepID=UPI00219DB2D9|nr:uncharacterized protein F4822DRAFT_424863 [Hypoxylon trugodes]KAI1394384.1 hypothetical protein F4822DRAFT_424863 [Hypoxylon trugodes]